LSQRCRLVRDRFVVYGFEKLHKTHEQVLELDIGDFVLSCGTFFYEGKVGTAALNKIYDDYRAGRSLDGEINGNYFLAIGISDELIVLNDFSGYYPVYCNDEKSVLSSSLIAVAKSGSKKPPSRQEFFEFMLNGYFAGDETVLPNVRLLKRTYMWRIFPAIKPTQRQPVYETFSPGASISNIAEDAARELGKYFSMLNASFSGTVGSALSGGYDSRPMIALLRQAGNTPYLYVYGDANSSDVTVAKEISNSENFNLEHIDKGALPQISPEAFVEKMEHDIYFFDGIKPLRIFDDGSDLATRLQRADNASLQLNGAGGEIYREIWNLNDRRINLVRFLKLRYDRGSYDFCQPSFDVDEYFARIAKKVRKTLDIERDWITRREVEMLFPFLRNLFAAPNNAANSQISDSLIPFMEPIFIFPSFDIPVRLKYYERLQAEIIKRVDPILAGYKSSYGINFRTPFPQSIVLNEWLNGIFYLPFAN